MKAGMELFMMQSGIVIKGTGFEGQLLRSKPGVTTWPLWTLGF